MDGLWIGYVNLLFFVFNHDRTTERWFDVFVREVKIKVTVEKQTLDLGRAQNIQRTAPPLFYLVL